MLFHNTLQAVKSRKNKDLSPALAKRKRQAMARVTEAILFVLNAANTSAALLVPSVVIAKTPAEPLPAAALTIMVCAAAVVRCAVALPANERSMIRSWSL